MTEKIRIAKPGYSYNDTNIAHVVFDSDINTFKIKTSSTISLTPSSSGYTLNHNLGYSPAFLAWFEVTMFIFILLRPSTQSARAIVVSMPAVHPILYLAGV